MTPAAPTAEASGLGPGHGGGNAGSVPFHGGDGGSGQHGGLSGISARPSTAIVGVWLLVGAIVILFASFASTLLVRRAEADWQAGPVPRLLWANTAILLVSSGTLEWARANGRRGRLDLLRSGLGLTTVLGTAFLAGQSVAWRTLLDGGVSMATGPHSAFFYLLTGTHALHLGVGVAALAYTLVRVRRRGTAVESLGIVTPTAIYWHFVDALWLFVFLLLFLG